jgi:hypothetical protein
MMRTFRWAVVGLFLLAVPAWAADKYTIKTVKTDPPKELKESIRQLLSNESVQLLDAKGDVLGHFWFRKEVPTSKATADQIKTGLTYRELEETSILGAVQYPKTSADYRKQKIKPGVYTLRLGYQPMDGDHMGVSTYQDFCLLVLADRDTKPGTMDPKALQDLSIKSIGTAHPGILMLFPYDKPEGKPKLAKKENNHWVIDVREVVKANDQKAAIGVGLTVIGHAE